MVELDHSIYCESMALQKTLNVIPTIPTKSGEEESRELRGLTGFLVASLLGMTVEGYSLYSAIGFSFWVAC